MRQRRFGFRPDSIRVDSDIDTQHFSSVALLSEIFEKLKRKPFLFTSSFLRWNANQLINDCIRELCNHQLEREIPHNS